MRIGFVSFISLFLAADLLCWFVSFRFLKRQRTMALLQWICHTFFAFQAAYVLLLVGSLVLGTRMRRGPDWLPTPLLALAFVWHIVGLPFVCLGILLTGVIRRLMGIGRWIRRRFSGSRVDQLDQSRAAEGIALSRRGFLAGSLAMVPPVLAAGATGYALATNGRFRTYRIRLAVADLPVGLKGFRIAHVSDLHVGHWATDAFLDDVTEATNALNADVVLFTGDLIDLSIADLPRAIAVARQWQARHGMFMIEGNHDLIDDPQGYWNGIRASGLRFLRNSTFTLDHGGTPVQLLGTAWAHSPELIAQDVRSVAAWRDVKAFPILLAHHPHSFDAAAEARLPLTLSGHTHGGQLGLGQGLSVGNLMYKYVSGVYEKPGAKLLVSNGTGNWFPLRVNAPAEIIEIELTSA